MGHDGPIGDVSIYQPAFSRRSEIAGRQDHARRFPHLQRAETSAASAPSLSREDGAEDEVIFDRVSLSMRWPLENRVVNSAGRSALRVRLRANAWRVSPVGQMRDGWRAGIKTGQRGACRPVRNIASPPKRDRRTAGSRAAFPRPSTPVRRRPRLRPHWAGKTGRRKEEARRLVFYSSWNANRETGTQNS